MELNCEQMYEKVRPMVDRLIDIGEKTPEEAPFAHFIHDDLQLALFFLICVDFINAQPTAMVNASAIQIKEDMAILTLPIPTMFQAYYDMRIKKLAAGEEVTPEDSIETPMPATGVATDPENLVVASDISDIVEKSDNGD